MKDVMKNLRSIMGLPLLAATLAMGVTSPAHAQKPSIPRSNLWVEGTGWQPDPVKRGILWGLVQDCVKANAAGTALPSNCARVHPHLGYVVLKDIKGAYHYLTLPIRRTTGIEDSILWAIPGPNYLHAAWTHKYLVEQAIGNNFAFKPTQFGIAVNSIFARSQDQLHIHMDCVIPEVTSTVQAAAAAGSLSTTEWVTLDPIIQEKYRARLIPDVTLATTDPFRMLANELLPKQSMLGETILITDVQLPDRRMALAMLVGKATMDQQEDLKGQDWPDRGGAEDLLDHECKAVKG